MPQELFTSNQIWEVFAHAELDEIRDMGSDLQLIYKNWQLFTPRFNDSPIKFENVSSRPKPNTFKKGAVKLESPAKNEGDNTEFQDDYYYLTPSQKWEELKDRTTETKATSNQKVIESQRWSSLWFEEMHEDIESSPSIQIHKFKQIHCFPESQVTKAR